MKPGEMSVWQSTPLPVAPTLRVSPSNISVGSVGGNSQASGVDSRDGIAFARPASGPSLTVATDMGKADFTPAVLAPAPVTSLSRNASAVSDTTATSKTSNSNLNGSSTNLGSTVQGADIGVRIPSAGKTASSAGPPKEEFVFAQPTSLPPRDK